ncbi:MAG: zinc-binding dehydrogenase [Candidatus Latescibacterota bacterium]|nr:MAG: zinc-binding dehydrogenase [Candidatus Latescibacterota bacterium]
MTSVPAAVMPAPGRAVEVRELPLPELEPGAALLEVEQSEVCGTDVHLRDGKLAGVPYPIIPGHVSVGRLARIRGRIADVEGEALSEGERVTFLDVHRTCHACWYCLVAQASTRCPQRKVYGITYGLSDGLTGGWARVVHLKPGTHCIRLQQDVPTTSFMAGGCALPTALHAVERGEIAIGDQVLVLGSGPVGLAAIILSDLRGAEAVLCIGGPTKRLRTAADVGACATLDFQSCDAMAQREWVLGRTGGRGADVTIEATGDPVAVAQAMRCTRDGGRVVVVGQYTDHGSVSFNPHLDLNVKHLDVRGCWGSGFSHFHRGARLLRDPSRRAIWERIPLQAYALEHLNEALDDVAAGRVVKALVDPRA